ncbi:DMT family transporter [Candidatus Woesearchaeota archaeon]|nr:DMT family transporter [Candidatus Woesearchaeota archaeon]
MLSGIMFAIAGMFFYGISTLFAKYLLEKEKMPPEIFAVLRLGISALFLLPLLVMGDINSLLSLTFKQWLMIISIGIIGAIPYFFFIKGLEKGEVSLTTALAKTSVIITLLLSFVFLDEVLSPVKYSIISMIILATLLISFKIDHKLTIKRSFVSLEYALLAAVGWGVVYFLMKFMVTSIGALASAFFLEFFVFVFTYIYVKVTSKQNMIAEFTMLQRSTKLFLLFAGLTVSLGTLFYAFAIHSEKVSLVIPITESSPFIALLGGYLFFKEQLSLQQKIGAIVIVICIVLLSIEV